MKKILFIAILFTSITVAQSDNKLPYYELPEASDAFTAGTVAARQVDALGFRFYHATDGLTEKDLAYKPTDSVRTTAETVDHIYDLSKIILNSTLKQANSKESANLTFKDKRAATLNNLKQAADILRASEDISQFKIIFGEREIPFWNNINGPIADAIWHCGQIASFRRVTGNPINPKVNHFTGTVKKE
ncbi:hypothetical protein [Olleya aquimaris]|uniref:DinB family protein n=1 Tax=Olleya aquimaris TaxID=639310 RepID=A0A327RHQ1_9FLAO|nr:hypothetical protein [Olleya aquimaris]RAJ13197.1 hypothetical protein LY08_02096 [Olleya aquimaris]